MLLVVPVGLRCLLVSLLVCLLHNRGMDARVNKAKEKSKETCVGAYKSEANSVLLEVIRSKEVTNIQLDSNDIGKYVYMLFNVIQLINYQVSCRTFSTHNLFWFGTESSSLSIITQY